MRLAFFFLINVLAAVGFGYLARSMGYGTVGTALVVIGVLAVLQLAYVLWLVAVSRLPEEEDAEETAPGSKPLMPPAGRRLSGAESVSGKQIR